MLVPELLEMSTMVALEEDDDDADDDNDNEPEVLLKIAVLPDPLLDLPAPVLDVEG
jgi:hypothetical protein